MDPRQPPWEVLIDDQDRVVPSRTAPADGPVTWSSGPLSSAVARYRVIQRADGSLDLAAVEYFDDYQPQEVRLAERWSDQDQRVHAQARSSPGIAESPPVQATALDQDIPVVIPVLAGPHHGTAGPDPERQTLENRLHAVDPPPASVPAGSTPAPAPAATSDPQLLWDYQSGESAADKRRRRQHRASSPHAAPSAPGASSAESRRQQTAPQQSASQAAPEAETQS